MHNIILHFLKLAIKNDMYIDSLENVRFGSKEILGFNIIKPSLFIDKLKSNFALKFCIRLIMILWFPLGFIFIIIKFIITLFEHTLIAKKKIDENKIVMLMFSHRLTQLKNQVNFQDKEFVDVYLSKKNLSESEYSIIQLANVGLITKSFLLAMKFHFSFFCDQSVELYQKMNSVFCFDWLIVYCTLENMAFKKIVFCNHYDRWAVLFDSIKSEKILIQHGLLSDQVFPPTKLNNINVLYAYNSNEAKIFVKNVLENVNEIKYLKPSLTLVDLELDSLKPSLLFISCLPITFQKELNLLNILKTYNIAILIKPHPVYPNNEYIKLKDTIDFYLVDQKNVFPKVDLVISYKSTLAYEYELNGTDIVYYDSFSNEDDMISDILNKLKL